jgi:hypothetical protein
MQQYPKRPAMSGRSKNILVACWLTALGSAIGSIFWQSEWKYNLPTPLPANYQPVPNGALIDMSTLTHYQKDKPVFLHFFNPDCPCSRFNMIYFKTLVKKYHERISFAVVLPNTGKQSTEKEIQEKYDLDIPVYSNKAIAKLCGVYSTPQAAIIDTDQRLFYRGNYNRSRYCTDNKTNYAQIAIDSLLAHAASPVLSMAAARGYGCELSECKK